MKCPTCEGKGGWYEYIVDGQSEWWNCPRCRTSGRITVWSRLVQTFWENVPLEFVEWVGDTFYSGAPEK